jgi:murein tripeptide amidase MpaA
MVDEIEWTIFPVINADGYVYSWTTDRMWRKNRYYDLTSTSARAHAHTHTRTHTHTHLG